MRVNVYAEEMPEVPRLEIITKEIEGNSFTALRIYLELPATVNGQQHQGPFIPHPGDDDSAAVTFWGKRDLRVMLLRAIEMLNEHYCRHPPSQDDNQKETQQTSDAWTEAHIDQGQG